MFIVQNNGRSGIGCLLIGILGLVLSYYAVRGLYWLLWYAAPALLVLALVVNWRAVASTGRDFIQLLQRNPLYGLLVMALGVVFFPLLSLFLFLKALGMKRVEEWQAQFNPSAREVPANEAFTDFEELDSRPKNTTWPTDPEAPETPPVPKEAPKPGNPYDKLFN